jgi:hypothetical protein
MLAAVKESSSGFWKPGFFLHSGGQSQMGLRVKMVSCSGALEYWSIGALKKAKARISISISPYRYSILFAPRSMLIVP